MGVGTGVIRIAMHELRRRLRLDRRCCPALATLTVLILLSAGTVSAAGSDVTPADSLRAAINHLRAEGHYEDALSAARQLLSLRASDPETKPHEVADAERLVATLELAIGLSRADRADLATADSLDVAIEQANYADDFTVGADLARRQFEIRRRLLGATHPETAASLGAIGGFIASAGDARGGEPYLREALAIQREQLGERHPDAVLTMNGVAYCVAGQGRYAEAAGLLRQGIDPGRSGAADECEGLAAGLSNLAVYTMYLGDYAEAETFARESLAMRRRLFGADHLYVVPGLHVLGTILSARAKYEEAERYLREALSLSRQALGNENAEVAKSLRALANLQHARGKLREAEALTREALDLWRRLTGPDTQDVARSLDQLALLLDAQGRYAEGDPLHREALAMHCRLLGSDHPFVGAILSNLSFSLQSRGDHAGAEPLVQQSLAIMRAAGTRESAAYAVTLKKQGLILQARGDQVGAESIFQETLAILRKCYGDAHPEVALGLDLLAGLRMERGDHAGAEQLYREALAIRRQGLGEEHSQIAVSFANLADALQAQGDLVEAESLQEQALATRRRLLGDRHPDVAQSLCALGSLRLVRGDAAGAEPLLREAARIFESARVQAGTGLDRATFVRRFPYPALALALLAQGKEQEAWVAVERSQGRVLADLLLVAGSRPLTPADAAQEESLQLELAEGGRQVEALRDVVGRDSTEEARARLDEARINLFETEARWGTFQQAIAAKYPLTEGQSFDLARVQVSLEPDEAILGWLAVDDERAPTLPRWAYVVRDRGPVLWRQMPEEAPGIESTTERLLGQLAHRPTVGAPQQVEAHALWLERMAPMEDLLDGVHHLFVVPSGDMVGVPLEALVTDRDGEVVGDRFSVSYVPSATIHAWLRERGNSPRSPDPTSPPRGEGRGGSSPAEESITCLAVGDPPFCSAHLAAPTDEAAEVHAALVDPSQSEIFTCVRGNGEPASLDQDLLLRSALAGDRESLQRLSRLRSTRDEAKSVADLHGADSRLLVGAAASEQRLVRMARDGELVHFRDIHFATHALMDDERPENSMLVLSQVDLPDAYQAALAGERIYDGCLTAAEIAREWKLNADLVTLSACETALGRKVAGEGYIGLAHAFLQAGAKSLLVSLWKVDDRATAMLMQRFYEDRLGRYAGVRSPGRASAAPLPKTEALAEAKRWLRTWRDDAGRRPYAHPFFWAGFVLMGDPG